MVFIFCLDNVPILSDVIGVHGAIHFNTLHLPKWWKSNLWQQQESQAAVCT